MWCTGLSFFLCWSLELLSRAAGDSHPKGSGAVVGGHIPAGGLGIAVGHDWSPLPRGRSKERFLQDGVSHSGRADDEQVSALAGKLRQLFLQRRQLLGD